MTKLIARAGETVTCENGHEICDVAEDIHPRSVVTPRQFTNWRPGMAQPVSGTPPAPCGVCGGRWCGVPPGAAGAVLHVAGEWRGGAFDKWAP